MDFKKSPLEKGLIQLQNNDMLKSEYKWSQKLNRKGNS